MKKILCGLYIPDEVSKKYSSDYILEMPNAGGNFSKEELTDKLKDANGYLGGFLNKELIDGSPNLEIACSFGAGYDGIDHKYAGEKGIHVMNAPHATTEPTAELAITLLLCLSRRILNFNRFLKERKECGGITAFVDAFDNAPPPTPVHGKVLGIVGFGKIGKAVARKAKGLGMRVIYYDVFRAPVEIENELDVSYCLFDDLLKAADYVTLHCLFTPENHHLMDAPQFKMMKPTAYFINAGRGGLMNEQALIEALNAKEILGAAIDVFEFEPKVSEELLGMDSVVLTPHIGTSTYESRVNMANEALSGITAQLSGGKSPTIVNAEFFKAKASV